MGNLVNSVQSYSSVDSIFHAPDTGWLWKLRGVFRYLAVCSFFLLSTTTPIVNAENLSDIYLLARANDPRILAAEYEKNAAALDIPIARASRRPNLSLFLDRDQEYDSSLRPDEDEGRFEPGLSLNIPLYNRRSNVAIDLAELSSLEASLGFVQQEQSLFMRTSQLYFNVLKGQNNVNIAMSAVEAFESQVELARGLVSERLISRSDVAEAQASFGSARATLIDAQNQLAAADEALKVAIGTIPENLVDIREGVALRQPDPIDVDSWVALGLEHNPTLKLTQVQLQSAALNVELSKSGHYPTLDLQASYTKTLSDVEANDDIDNAELSLKFNLPLYQGGVVQARSAQADLRRELATQQLVFSQRALEEQVRNAFANVNSSIERAKALQQAVRSNEASLEGIRIGVEVQTRTFVDLLDATNRLVTAKVELSEVRYDYLFNVLLLKSLTGELELSDLNALDRWLE